MFLILLIMVRIRQYIPAYVSDLLSNLCMSSACAKWFSWLWDNLSDNKPVSLQLYLNIFEYSMSGKPSDDTTGQVRPEGDTSDEKVETANQNEGDVMPSPQEEVLSFVNNYVFLV